MGDCWIGPGKSKRIGKGEDEQNFEGARESGVLGWDRQDRQDRNRHETLSFSEQARCSLSVLMGRHYPFIRGEGRSGRGVPAATAAEVPVLPPYRLVSRGTLQSSSAHPGRAFAGPMASRPTPPGLEDEIDMALARTLWIFQGAESAASGWETCVGLSDFVVRA